MDEFIRKATSKTPEIKSEIKTGTISIKGMSIPEDGRTFFTPFIKWLFNFVNTTDKTILIEVELEYFNTSTSNILLDIFKHLSIIHEDDKKDIKITWIYEEDDLEIKEVGEDYQIMVGDIVTLRSKPILK